MLPSEKMEYYKYYMPNFECSTDGNGKGIINSKVGLITYDEAVYAGGYYYTTNASYYLRNGLYSIWTMSQTGFSSEWVIGGSGGVAGSLVTGKNGLHPVINLNADIIATGTGTSSDPYVIKTN